MEYAGFWNRVGAGLIDLAIVSITSFFIVLAAQQNGITIYPIGSIFLGLSYIWIIVFFTYGMSSSLVLISYLATFLKGRTFGQYSLGLKVIDTNGNRIGLLHLAMRLLILLFPMILFTLMTTGFINTNDPSQQVLKLIFCLAGLSAPIIQILWIIPIAFTDEKKAIHDMICRTRVIKNWL